MNQEGAGGATEARVLVSDTRCDGYITGFRRPVAGIAEYAKADNGAQGSFHTRLAITRTATTDRIEYATSKSLVGMSFRRAATGECVGTTREVFGGLEQRRGGEC